MINLHLSLTNLVLGKRRLYTEMEKLTHQDPRTLLGGILNELNCCEPSTHCYGVPTWKSCTWERDRYLPTDQRETGSEGLQVGSDRFKMAAAERVNAPRGPASLDMGTWREDRNQRSGKSSSSNRDCDYSWFNFFLFLFLN